ncbi:uncharacterized protein LOC116192213 isoform X2 [Punica granatum]|uniref:Uncharacterized protein LOC116192213 isoform X2 n=1 Tax=Punica granatum TaxID=22663 RepID=A0A6P8C492_PUNGR|nr:uncharacterized protein LOC116192213 isoform X2 [Punica granatum]
MPASRKVQTPSRVHYDDYHFLIMCLSAAAARASGPKLQAKEVIIIITSFMEVGGGGPTSSSSPWRSPTPTYSYSRPSPTSYWERLAAIGLALLAVLSPLFIDRRPAADPEDEELFGLSAWLIPLLLLGLMIAIAASLYLDRSLTRFDPYWIHRVGGSSGGIIIILIVLALVLKSG